LAFDPARWARDSSIETNLRQECEAGAQFPFSSCSSEYRGNNGDDREPMYHDEMSRSSLPQVSSSFGVMLGE
jgi:hypothetical protein